MKKIGIVGGVAWGSTVEIYKTLCQLAQARAQATEHGLGPTGAPQMPEFSIESLNIARSQSLRGIEGDEASWAGFDAYFRAALLRLQASGADFALIASNTPHNRFDAITAGLSLPVLNLFELVAEQAAALGLRRLLILGTEPTMRGQALPSALARQGIESCGPAPGSAERAALLPLILELQAAPQPEAAAAQIRALALQTLGSAAQARDCAVCLACTELPLAYPDQIEAASFEAGGLRYLNTTNILAQAAFAHAIAS
ncbi:aspartate/glutamate racemase family protein [Paucibacter sp. DJ2R-2]|uniref:aspartate/glutamate racemase family protein n=1 Tax=Paucibacter sp. DJ2R-2 TaxID=2893558 RepID=UPI0021E4C4D5|nr:aspartate/glutamate racemase family protein [Paucibacter sp. DJ2R-2]MCV2418988.1 aspartate/glutamate racemase family protein [Paucibacter sp. DJ4R-1]MCV2438057.1 aspartate/glutamate racemase family protein [Paucibacter sp. DJ2R-2]